MSKQAYRKARRLIRDNGYFALRWLRMSEASIMMQLRYQKPDALADKAYPLALRAFISGVSYMKLGILWQPGALWIGAHYSKDNRLWCINLLSCITIWVMLQGGRVPRSSYKIDKRLLVVPRGRPWGTTSAGPGGPTLEDRRFRAHWFG